MTLKKKKLTDSEINKISENIHKKLRYVVEKTDVLIRELESQKIDFDKYYSEIENAIMEWNRDGNKTAGTLTRKIIRILKKKK